jgi:hypothetical protein
MQSVQAEPANRLLSVTAVVIGEVRTVHQGRVTDEHVAGRIILSQGKISSYWKCRTLTGKTKLLVSSEELPLSSAAQMNLHERVLAVQAVLKEVHGRFGRNEPMNRITECTEEIAPMLGTSGKRVRRWALQFIVLEGMFRGVAYKCRASNSIINDEAARAQMIQWMVTASTAKPPAKAADFSVYVNTTFNTNIKQRTAMVWLHTLGFSYKIGTAQEVYNDGHQCEDVKAALVLCIRDMQELLQSTLRYTCENMDKAVIGAHLRDQTRQRHIISYHDECCCHASDSEKRRWSTAGKGGKMSDKSRGAARMVAAYVSDAVGLWTESLKVIGPWKNKDDWWDGDQTQMQAAEHLLEFDRRFNTGGGVVAVCVDVYDNSSGHNCKAKDGLDVGKLNLGPGGAADKALIIRRAVLHLPGRRHVAGGGEVWQTYPTQNNPSGGKDDALLWCGQRHRRRERATGGAEGHEAGASRARGAVWRHVPAGEAREEGSGT